MILLNMCVCVCVCVCVCACLADYCCYKPEKSPPYAAIWCLCQLSRSALCLYWMHLHAQCEICGWMKIYRGSVLYSGIVSAGHRDRWTNIVFFSTGWCGSLALVNNSPALLSNLSHCETRLRVEWQGHSLIFFLPESLTRDFLFQSSMKNKAAFALIFYTQPLLLPTRTHRYNV